MNVGKSIRLCLAEGNHKTTWLADKLGVTGQRVRVMCMKKHIGGALIDKIAKCFDMEASEFIKLGEDKK